MQGDSQSALAAAVAAASSKSINLNSDNGKFPVHQPESDGKGLQTPELVLPTGPSLYSANVWSLADMRRIRGKFKPAFFSTYNTGLQKYYSKDWGGARQSFEAIIEHFDDGPSQYFLNEMKKHNYVPPPHFQAYGRA
jgi:TolA-binding protein